MRSSEGGSASYPIGRNQTVTNNISVGGAPNIFFWSGTPMRPLDAPINGSHENVRVTNNLVLQTSGAVADVPVTTGITFDHNLWSSSPPSGLLSSTDVVDNPLLVEPNHARTGTS